MEMKEEREIETEVFHIGIIFLTVGLGAGILYFLFIRNLLPDFPCPFSTLVGIYCPGCGGTRAVVALLQGKILLSLWYHPLVLYSVVVGGGFMLTQGMERLGVKYIKGWKFHEWYLYGAVLLIGCNFLIKNMLRLIWGITI